MKNHKRKVQFMVVELSLSKTAGPKNFRPPVLALYVSTLLSKAVHRARDDDDDGDEEMFLLSRALFVAVRKDDRPIPEPIVRGAARGVPRPRPDTETSFTVRKT